MGDFIRLYQPLPPLAVACSIGESYGTTRAGLSG